MKTGLAKVFWASIFGMYLGFTLISGQCEAAQPPEVDAVTYKCSFRVTCPGQSAKAVPGPVESTLEQAKSKAMIAANNWKTANCPTGTISATPLCSTIPGVADRSSDVDQGHWVVCYQCKIKEGGSIYSVVRGCTYCEALNAARAEVCEWESVVGGFCGCSVCILERPCCCRRCR